MRAAVYMAPGVLEIADIPVPMPEEGEVLLKVRFCGICGTDLHEYESGNYFYGSARPPNSVFGHELSGSVVLLGPSVEDLQVGDLVTVNPSQNCQACSFCVSGDEHLCQEPGGAVGYTRPGGLAEYVVVKARRCVALPPGTPADRAALTEPLAVALHAVTRANPQPAETVLIVGGGPIGQLTLLALKQVGVGRVVVSEPTDGRRERARRLGADAVVDPAKDGVGAALKAMTNGRGADVAFECVGLAAPLDDCFAATRRGGRIVVAGVFQKHYPMDLARLVMSEHQILGAVAYRDEFARAAALIAFGGLDVSPVISHRIPLDWAPEAFASVIADRGAHEKVLVQPSIS